MISTANLSYDYGKTSENEGEPAIAIKNINLSIGRGSFVAIIGKNGSGKSTFAKHINALLLPTEGTIWVGGYDTKDGNFLWEIRRSTGMVFQNPDNQIVSSVVEDDVAFGPENLGIPSEEIRERVDASLKAVGMYDYRKKAPHLLSGGQKQRIAIAGVIAMKPDCIVFDEPTAMLDPLGRSEVMKIIKHLHSLGITVILITHFMEEAGEAERIIVMDEGQVVLDNSPRELFKKVDEIKAMGLDVPLVVDLCQSLRAKGLDLPLDIITIEELGLYLNNLSLKTHTGLENSLGKGTLCHGN